VGGPEFAVHSADFEAVAESLPFGLRLVGNADGRVIEELAALVASLHDQIAAAGAQVVAVDIRQLEFMNASCFNVFVTWLGLINELASERRYALRFATNPAIPWQRRSLRTLSCFATDLISVA
jgi:hypothetical protein